MSLGNILQIVGNGVYDANIPNNQNRHSLQVTTQCFDNEICTISRTGDLYTPTKILCYNCSEDFSINSIQLIIGGNIITEINDTKFLDFINFSENIYIDNTLNKVYHLDKTKLFFSIKLVALQYHEVKIRISKTGNCNTIKLNGVYDFLTTQEIQETADNPHINCIKQMKIGAIQNYNSDQLLSLHMDGNVNGFILTDINPNIINSIKLKLNGIDRLDYQDKLEIMMNTQFINDNTIYINLNESNYYDDVTNSSLNTSRMDNIQLQLGLDEGNNGINFKIGCYSNNVLRIASGSGAGDILYSFHHYIVINNSPSVSTSQPWAKKPKLMEGNTTCPVMYEDIQGEFICCHQCKNNFDSSIIDNWIKTHKNCPMCRVTWNDFTIYINETNNESITTVN